MYNKKTAFTLTEILVTLAIVGIVAAMTLPGIISGTNSKISGAAIGRGVELLESGMKNVFEAAQSNNIYAENLAGLTIGDVFGNADLGQEINALKGNFIADQDYLFDLSESIIGAERINDDNYLASVVLWNSTPISETYAFFATAHIYRFLKTNSYIIVQPINIPNGANVNNNNVILTRIFIDANGNSLPNTVGQDIFMFGLSNRGLIIPAGTAEYNNNIMNENIALFRNDCYGANMTDGRSCAARIANDGWQINYQ